MCICTLRLQPSTRLSSENEFFDLKNCFQKVKFWGFLKHIKNFWQEKKLKSWVRFVSLMHTVCPWHYYKRIPSGSGSWVLQSIKEKKEQYSIFEKKEKIRFLQDTKVSVAQHRGKIWGSYLSHGYLTKMHCPHFRFQRKIPPVW